MQLPAGEGVPPAWRSHVRRVRHVRHVRRGGRPCLGDKEPISEHCVANFCVSTHHEGDSSMLTHHFDSLSARLEHRAALRSGTEYRLYPCHNRRVTPGKSCFAIALQLLMVRMGTSPSDVHSQLLLGERQDIRIFR